MEERGEDRDAQGGADLPAGVEHPAPHAGMRRRNAGQDGRVHGRRHEARAHPDQREHRSHCRERRVRRQCREGKRARRQERKAREDGPPRPMASDQTPCDEAGHAEGRSDRGHVEPGERRRFAAHALEVEREHEEPAEEPRRVEQSAGGGGSEGPALEQVKRQHRMAASLLQGDEERDGRRAGDQRGHDHGRAPAARSALDQGPGESGQPERAHGLRT